MIITGIVSAVYLLIFFFIAHLLINRWRIKLAAPVGALFWVADVLWNITYGSLFFLQPPKSLKKDFLYRYTLTARVYYNVVAETGWRLKLGKFAMKVIEKVDPEHFK